MVPLYFLYSKKRRGRASVQGPQPGAVQVLLSQMQHGQYNHHNHLKKQYISHSQ
jgi:hypothetical protein